MKTQEIALTCRYAQEEIQLARIIQESFELFLKRELRHTEKRPCAPA